MTKENRWTAIYGIVRSLGGSSLPSAIFAVLEERHPRTVAFSTLYTDLGRMSVSGWLIEREITDDQGRSRRAFSARPGGPPRRAESLRGLRTAFATA